MRFILAFAILFFGAGEALADIVKRDLGLYGNVSIGRGSIGIECERCYGVPNITEALSLTGSVGFKLNPRVGVLGEYWMVRLKDHGTEWFLDNAPHEVAQHIVALAVQVWMSENIWLKAGVGTGWHISDSPYAQVPISENRSASQALGGDQDIKGLGPVPRRNVSGERSGAVYTAVGWEFLKSKKIAIDVQLRVGKTMRPEYQFQIYNTAVNFGFTWF